MAWTAVRFFSLILLVGSINATWHPKVIGGHNTSIKQYPSLVSIRERGEHMCGGTIISDRHILTAAHCVYGLDTDEAQKLRIHSGTSSTQKEGTVHKVLSLHVHPKFNMHNREEGYPHDIAILTLKDPIVFNKYQQKINLPSHNVENYQVADVVGWGRSSRNSWGSSKQVQKLRVVLLTNEKCQPLIKSIVSPVHVCAFRSDVSGSCHGDSGGPLFSKDVIVGIVSRGDNGICADGVPDIYTNVFAYKDFIESVMKE